MNDIIAGDLLTNWGVVGGPDWEDRLYSALEEWAGIMGWSDHHTACLYAGMVEYAPAMLDVPTLKAMWQRIIGG